MPTPNTRECGLRRGAKLQLRASTDQVAVQKLLLLGHPRQIRQRGNQDLEGRFRLEPRQRSAQAEVRTETEPDVAARLAAGPPIAWADFVTETALAGQGQAILEALRELGADFTDFQEVRGGLSLTQAADRAALWAQDLR